MNANEATLLYVDEFSRMAEAYDRNVVPRFEAIAREVLRLANLKAGELVLDIGRLLSRRERGHPEHPVRDARFAQHRLPRQAVRRRGEQPGHPRLRMGPRVPGGPPGAQARRSVHLQRVADRQPDDVWGAPPTPGEVRDRDAVERTRSQ